MLSAEQLLERLREAGHWVTGDQSTDENGIAWLIGASVRTLRDWRERGIGPAWRRTVRVAYPLDEFVAWNQEQMAKREKQSAASVIERQQPANTGTRRRRAVGH